MISNRIFHSSIQSARILARFGSNLSKQSSTNNTQNTNSSSEYLADDYFSYNTFSYYDVEAQSTKYRLPQPSSYAPLKPPEPAPPKK